MKHAFHVLIRTIGFVVAGAALGAVALVVWLLATPAGARFAVAHVPSLIAMDLWVGEFDGRLTGPLEVRDFRLHLPTIDITIDHARVEWMPTALLDRNVHVDWVEAGRVVITIHPGDPHEPPSDEPAKFPQLPIGLIVGRGRIDELRLQVAPDLPEQVITRIALERSRWVGPEIVIGHLAADYGPTGPLEASTVASMGKVAAAVQSLTVKAPGENGAEVHAKGRVRLDGRPSDLALDWKNLRWPLALAPGEMPAVTSREGTLAVNGTLDDAQAKGRFALGDTATIEGRARYTPKALEAHLAWTRLAWPIFGPPRVASESGTIDVTGQPEAYRYRLDGVLAAEGYAGVAKASGHGTLADVTLETLNLAVGDATVDGAAHVAWDPSVTIDADVAIANVDPGLISPDWPGSLNGHVKAVTSVEGSATRSTFTVALDRSRLRDRDFALDATGDLANEQVTLSAFELRAGASKVTGKGRVTPPFDASAQVDSPDLAALWPGLAGQLSMRASVQGSLDTLHVVTAGTGERLSYAGVAIDAASIDADVRLDGAWRAKVDAKGVTGPVELTHAALAVDGSAAAHDLKVNVEAPQGTAELAAHGAFDRRALAWKGAVTNGTIVFGTLTPWSLEDAAALEVSRATVALQPACWKNAASRACAQVTHTGTRLRTAFRLENIDYAWFAPLMPAGWVVSGGLGGTGVLQLDDGHLSDARADLAFAPSRIERDGETLLQTLDGTATAFHDRGTVKGKLHLPIQGGHIDLDGQIGDAIDPLQRPLDARLDVLVEDLAFLRIASPEIEKATGRIAGTLRWSGTTGAPRASGTIALTGGAFRLGRPGLDLEKVEAHVAAADSGSLDVTASATSGDGTLAIKGRANVLGEQKGVQLKITGDKFQAANTAEVRATISPDLTLSIKGTAVDVTGTLTVPKASITPVTFDSGIAPTSDQRISRKGEADGDAGMTLTADVNLVLGSKVHFEGFGLKTDLTGSVRAIEQPGRPGSGRGEVRLEGGRYKAYGQDLQIEQGRLLFNGGPLTEPGLEIRAFRKPTDEVEIDVLVRGTLAKPLFQISSVPAMPRERQLAWLVLGHDLESTGSGDERAMLANAALSLGLTGTDFIAQNLRGRLGLDEISIAADAGDEADQARFTIGKYLSPKLYVSYGVGIFQPGNVFKLLYDLGHGFKLSTESGVVTGGDLLYTVETGKPEKPDTPKTAVPEAGR